MNAIVLRLVPYREADVIATLFTRDLGKISGLARAARKSRRRFGGALGLLTLIDLELAERRRGQMYTLRGAQPVESFAELATDMAAYAHASYATELVRELTADEQPDESLFDLLLALYRELRAGASVPMLRAFELETLALVGLMPVLDQCAACGASDDDALDEHAVLDPAKGGVLCRACAGRFRGPGARALPSVSRRLLLEARSAASLRAARDIQAAPEAAAAARDALLAVILAHVGKPLRSLEFISKLRGRGS